MNADEYASMQIDKAIEDARDCPIPVKIVDLDAQVPMSVYRTIEVDMPKHVGGFQMVRTQWRYDCYIDQYRRRRVFIPRRV